MEFAKTDCFGSGPSLEALVIFGVMMIAGVLYAWTSLRPARPPGWSLTGRGRRRG